MLGRRSGCSDGRKSGRKSESGRSGGSPDVTGGEDEEESMLMLPRNTGATSVAGKIVISPEYCQKGVKTHRSRMVVQILWCHWLKVWGDEDPGTRQNLDTLQAQVQET
jgi:hypothetical protein